MSRRDETRNSRHTVRLAGAVHDHHDVLLSTCSEKHLTWHDCRPDKRAYPESCDLEFCEMLELAGIDLPFIRFDAERAYQLQDTPFHGKQASELKKRAEASPSTNPAYVLYSDTLGVYLGNVLGLGFWSKLDPFGQGGAPTFESPDRVRVVIERKPFGRLVIQEEGRAYFGETYQRMFLESHTRLPDKINEVLPDMLAAEERALKKPAKGPRPG